MSSDTESNEVTSAALASRKSAHLDLTISGDVGFRRTTLLEQVTLMHSALPEVSFGEIDLTARLFGKRTNSPVVIASMTGGNNRAGAVNRQLAEVAERGGYAIGLGSQRAMVKTGKIDPEITRGYQLRDVAPSVPILGNIGVIQAGEMSTDFVEEMVGLVGADALCVHLNPAQEIIQHDGDRDFRGALETLGRLARDLSVPIIAKETGCGISHAVGSQLRLMGVEHVDLSGAGGTSWVGVETRRAEGELARKGEAFWDWGIPTAASVLQVRNLKFRSVIATGGIQTGLDVARAIALGATAAGMARPIIQALDTGGVDGALARLAQVDEDLRTAMLLTGSATLRDLGRVQSILGAELRQWVPSGN